MTQVAVQRALGDVQPLADVADAQASFAVPEEVARGELRPLRNPDDDQ